MGNKKIICKIPLTNGDFAIVDKCDFEELSKHKWYKYKNSNTYYVIRKEPREKNKQKTIYMHRQIMCTPVGFETDHIDGNGLNNSRSNLRICTHQQNNFNRGISKKNTSGFRGVSWNKHIKRWVAVIHFDNKRLYLGSFKDILLAKNAYISASIKYHGEFSIYK